MRTTDKVSKFQFFMIAVVIVLSALAYGTVHQPTIALLYLTISLMMLIWIVKSMFAGTVEFSRHLIQVPLFAACAYALVQAIPFGSTEVAGLGDIPRTISLAPFFSKLTAIQFAALGLFLSLCLRYIDSAARLRRIVNVLIIFGTAYAFFAIIQSIISPTKIFGVYERDSPFGTFVNRHNFAAFIEMLVFLPIGMLLSGTLRRDQKLLYITASAIMGLSLLMSGSRGGLIAAVGGAALLGLLTLRGRGKKDVLVKALLAGGIAIVTVVGAMLVGGETTFTRIASTAASKDVTTQRGEIWAVTLKVISANLPLGAGFGAFGQAYTPFDPYSGLERVEQSHNDYLQVLADAGIPGAVIGGLFLFLIYRTARNVLRSQNALRRALGVAALAGIFSVLIHSLFDFTLHTSAVALLFVLSTALLVVCERTFADDIKGDGDRRKKRRSSSSSNVTPIDTTPKGNVRIGRS